MGPNVKYEFPDSQQITVDDYADLLDDDFMKSHLPFFWSQIGADSAAFRIQSWYQKEIFEPSRAQRPPFQSNPNIFGVGESVHREGMFTSTAFQAGWTRGQAQYSYERDNLQAKEFQKYYENKCRSKYGKKWNMVHTQGMRLSQAYAMHAVGPVALLFTEPHRDGRNMSRNTSWGGCEFPRLTKNKSIQKIYQVDLKKPLFDKEGKLNPRLIWSRPDGDGPTKHEPLGHLYSFGGYKDRVYEPCRLLDKVLEERTKRKKKDDHFQGAGVVVPTQPGTENTAMTPKIVTLHVRPTSNTATAPKTQANTVEALVRPTSSTATAPKTHANTVKIRVPPTKTSNPPITVPPPVPVVSKPPTPETSTSQSKLSPQPQPNDHPNYINCKFKRARKRFLSFLCIKPKKQRK